MRSHCAWVFWNKDVEQMLSFRNHSQSKYSDRGEWEMQSRTGGTQKDDSSNGVCVCVCVCTCYGWCEIIHILAKSGYFLEKWGHFGSGRMFHFGLCITVRFQGEVIPLSGRRSFGQSHSQHPIRSSSQICRSKRCPGGGETILTRPAVSSFVVSCVEKVQARPPGAMDSFWLWCHHNWRPFLCL